MFMLLFPLTVFIICHPLRESRWNKIKGIQFLQSNDIQELPGAEHPGAAAEIQWKAEDRTQRHRRFGEKNKRQQGKKKQNYCGRYSVKYTLSFQMPMSNTKYWISIYHAQEFAWFYKFLYNTVDKKFIVQ